LQTCINFNYDYDDGTNSDGAIEPFFGAVEGENEQDSDGDIGPHNEPPIEEQLKPQLQSQPNCL
jgi:hypothetical protein